MHNVQLASARGPAVIARVWATCVQTVSRNGLTDRDGNAEWGQGDRSVKHVGNGTCSYG